MIDSIVPWFSYNTGAPDSGGLPKIPHVAGRWSNAASSIGNYTQLFDLLNDPNETTDVAAENPSEYNELETYLDQVGEGVV
jgi:hypothetical protein